ncbi:hypothetical protein C8F04DRAFT_1261024 [Mycena alexandri]|uniref:Uncharacterized protein n=1 Tax=Mycena alexandri TaxID=1745969 RepID=A0AAD6WZF6_9AGAR|nr:hypothetical protein C8F04DRAFT_1261024 [Mycena alexandri]
MPNKLMSNAVKRQLSPSPSSALDTTRRQLDNPATTTSNARPTNEEPPGPADPTSHNSMNLWTNVYPRTPRTTPHKVWDERVRFGVDIAAPALRYNPMNLWTNRRHCCPRSENPMNFWTSVYSRTYPTTPRKVWDERVRFSVGIAAPAPRIQRTFGPTSALGPPGRRPARFGTNAFDLASASLPLR